MFTFGVIVLHVNSRQIIFLKIVLNLLKKFLIFTHTRSDVVLYTCKGCICLPRDTAMDLNVNINDFGEMFLLSYFKSETMGEDLLLSRKERPKKER